MQIESENRLPNVKFGIMVLLLDWGGGGGGGGIPISMHGI